MTNKKLTFEEMASSYRCCDNGDLNEKHDCLKQNTDIDEVVEELSETIVEQVYPKMVDFQKGFIGVTDVEDSIASLLRHALTTHGQKIREEERERIRKEVADLRYEHANTARHGDTPDDAYDRVENILQTRN